MVYLEYYMTYTAQFLKLKNIRDISSSNCIIPQLTQAN